MYRHNRAFQFEKEQLGRGGDFDNTPFSSFGDITKPRSIALESFVTSEAGIGQTLPLQTYQNTKEQNSNISKTQQSRDPNEQLYLAAALGSLGLKNDRTNNANGNVIEMLEPDVQKIKRQIEREIEQNRLLDNSAVEKLNKSHTTIARGANHIAEIIKEREKQGILIDNSKPKPVEENSFYKALTKNKTEM